VLYEQNADLPIPPASVTKILTLYLVFDALKQGEVHSWDHVPVSKRAATTGGSRMGLRTGKDVALEELVKGIAVVSGNDAAVAAAEYLAGSVENFVSKMNAKARELGMVNSEFKTPNGLPAPGQVTTARDLAKLSRSYIQHYPEALHIHSMTSYTYLNATHHNANRLLGACPGVDGIKTGFVCASGFNLAATAKRGEVRLIAVALGARNPWLRTIETERLLEAGFQKMASGSKDSGPVEELLAKHDAPRNGKNVRVAGAVPTGERQGTPSTRKRSRVHGSHGRAADTARTCPQAAMHTKLEKKAAVAEDACPVGRLPKSGAVVGKKKLHLAKATVPVTKEEATPKPASNDRHPGDKKDSATKETATSKKAGPPKKSPEQDKSPDVQIASKTTNGTRQKAASGPPKKTN
jgi:D-alanyl-D-alanine carboxypeptidase